MRKIFKISIKVFLYIPFGVLQFTLHYLTKLVPKQKNLILFGSWGGQQVRGNVKYLFLYMLKNEKNFECIWITQNKNLYNRLKNNNVPCLYWLSFFGLLKTIRAKVFFVSHGHHDINYYCSGGAIVINLMHYVYCIKEMSKVFHGNNFIKYLYIILQYPLFHLINCVDYYLCVSNFQENIVKQIFKISENEKKTFINYGIKKDFLLSNNKNDFIFEFERQYELNLDSNKKNIFFLPTRRNYRKKIAEFDLFKYNFDPVLLENILRKNNAMLYINFHPLTVGKKFSLFERFTRIKILESKGDVNNILMNQFQILITDYSSVYSDFLIFNKPIILAPFDYKSYIFNDRKLIPDYFNLPSPIVKDWKELAFKIDVILNLKDDPYKKNRNLLKDKIYSKIGNSGFKETLKILNKLVKY